MSTNFIGGLPSILKSSTVQRANCDINELDINGLMKYKPSTNDETGQFLFVENIDGEIGFSAGSGTSIIPQTVIEVSTEFPNIGQQRNTISGAITLASTLSPSIANQILIDVYPGLYIETVQIVVPSFVIVQGRNENTCIAVLGAPLPAGEAFFNLSSAASELADFTINANSLSDHAVGQYDPAIGANGLKFYRNLIITNGLVSNFFCRYPGNVPILIGCRVVTQIVDTPLYGVYVQDFGQLGMAGGIGIFNITGVRGVSRGWYFLDAPLLPGIFRSHIFSNSTSGFNVGLYAENSDVLMTSADVANCNTAIKLVNSSGTFISTVINQPSGTHYEIDSTSNLYGNSCIAEIDRINITMGTGSISYTYIEENQNNQSGLHSLGSIISGDVTCPATSFFGQGSYNIGGQNFLKTVDGITFIDVSADLLPSNAVNTVVFDNLTTSIFYVGDNTQFQTIEYNCTSIFGTGIVSTEYWNGLAWTAFNISVTQHDSPYGSYANHAFSALEEQDIRFDLQLSTAGFNWSLTTVNGTSKYWVRMRITSVLSVSPEFDIMRILYNSTKIDNNGTLLRYGQSRTYKTIPFDINNIVGISGATAPTGTDIWFGEDSRLGRSANELSVSDLFGFSQFVPVDMDTSTPMRLIFAFLSNSTAAAQADFNIQLTYGNVLAGSSTYTTQAAANGNLIGDQQQITINLTPNQVDGSLVVIQEIFLPIPFLMSRDSNGQIVNLLSIDFERLAGNANNIVFAQLSILYLSFTDGLSL